MVFQMTDCWKQDALIDTAEAVEHAKNSREMKTNVAAVDKRLVQSPLVWKVRSSKQTAGFCEAKVVRGHGHEQR